MKPRATFTPARSSGQTRWRSCLACVSLGFVFGALVAIAAQQPAVPYVPRQSDRPESVNGDEADFKPIFDGKSLDGWEGNPAYWRVQDGSLVGEITPDTVIKSNTFIIWRGGRPVDFELKLDYTSD
jgi:3-keto-disaccharide hydrolase